MGDWNNSQNPHVPVIWCFEWIKNWTENGGLLLTCRWKAVSLMTCWPVQSRTGGTLTKSFRVRSNRISPPLVENLNRSLSGKEWADRFRLAWFWSSRISTGTVSTKDYKIYDQNNTISYKKIAYLFRIKKSSPRENPEKKWWLIKKFLLY